MEDNKVVITKVLNASIEKVWDAWTKEEQLMQWKAPMGMMVPSASTDLQIGGAYHIVMRGDTVENKDMKLLLEGMYKTIEKPHKLSFTWKWEGQDEETLVTVLFKSLAEKKTEVTLIHEGFKTRESRNGHSKGWESTLGKLSILLNR